MVCLKHKKKLSLIERWAVYGEIAIQVRIFEFLLYKDDGINSKHANGIALLLRDNEVITSFSSSNTFHHIIL